MSKTPLTLQEFLNTARSLYVAFRDAEHEFYTFLYRGETEWKSLWASTGMNYDQFLQEYRVLSSKDSIGRYRSWLASKSMKVAGGGVLADAIPRIGIDAVVEASKLKTPEQRREAVERFNTHVEVNGSTPSQATAALVVKDIRTADAVTKSRGASYMTLAEKCKQLEAEVKRLKSENAALRSEIAALKKMSRAA